MTKWTTSDIPDQHGRLAIVTGTGGLGFEDALALARAGAEVIVAGRNPAKGAEALAEIRKQVAGAKVQFEEVDLASLDSIAAFGARMRAAHTSLDLLINNAAVMTPPDRRETADGFELQFGTNYLGHFALTAELLPLLRAGHKPRVVNLSSVGARQGKINFADLQSNTAYRPMAAYAQSKLAQLMFGFELQRRSDAAGWGLTSIGAHPGIARTDLLTNGAGANSLTGLARRFLWFLFQPADMAALPTLFAATAPDARPGRYYGPDRLSEMRGDPALAKPPAAALDEAVAIRLWDVSEMLSGRSFG